MNTSNKILPLLFQAVIEGQHVGETLAPAVVAEGHVKFQGEVFVLSAFFITWDVIIGISGGIAFCM